MALLHWNDAKENAQIDELTRALDRFAKGDLSGTFPAGSGSEHLSRLGLAARNLQDRLVQQRSEADALATAIAEMSRAHDAGAIDVALPVDRLAEPYRSIGANINTLVKSHIDLKMRVVSLITKYVSGDCSETMEPLPGKRVQISDALEHIRQRLPKPEEIAATRRTKAALKILKANVMIADTANVICYMNDTVTAMMRDAERDLQKDLPNFRADKLIASKIDLFHKNPSHQTRMLADLRGTHSVEILVGGRTMSLIANP